jgi:LmbE family N-acetylglucosaminyl deacetylase/Leucine-rich repeat (LRR) protein
MKQAWKRFAAALLLLLIVPLLPLRTAEADGEAQNLTDSCTLFSDLSHTAYRSRISDDDLRTSQHFSAGVTVGIAWTDAVPVRAVYVAFLHEPGRYLIRQYDANGALLSETEGTSYINDAIIVEDGTRRVVIDPGEDLDICSLYAYGEGAIPNIHDWQPTPEKLDYLIIAMHPDDDVLFMGAIVPIYTAQKGLEGSILYMATRERVRKDEAMNGAWTMGLRSRPILDDMPDIPDTYRTEFQSTFKQADVTREVVRFLRRYKPEVVFSHDVNGEYGHWQHQLLSAAVLNAAPLASDPTYDEQSYTAYGAWEVKKLYLHLYAENKITLPATEPLAAFDGKTPFDIATEAFECHKSQLQKRHAVRNEGIYSLSDFGLAYTTVGTDTAGLNDPFEHIDPAALHNIHAATSAATAEPVEAPTDEPILSPNPIEPETTAPVAPPTAAPTESQTDAPIALQTAAPTESQTDAPIAPQTAAPTEVPAPSAPTKAQRNGVPWLLLAVVEAAASIALLVFAAVTAAKLQRKNGEKQRRKLCRTAILLASAAVILLTASGFAAWQWLQGGASPAPAANTALPAVEAGEMPPENGAGNVTLTDGTFPSDSTSLKLPHFSESDAAALQLFPNLTTVDVTGSNAFDLIAACRSGQPDLHFVFSLPVGNETLTENDTTLLVTGVPDLPVLAQAVVLFPNLETLDLRQADVNEADLKVLQAECPQLSVLYSVSIGTARVDADSETVAFAGTGVKTAEEAAAILSALPNLASVDLHGSELNTEDALALEAAFPNVAFSYSVPLFGAAYESDVTEIDLSDAVVDGDIVAALRPFRSLVSVCLPDGIDESVYDALEAEHPETFFRHTVTVLGQTVQNDVEELDASGKELAEDEVREALRKLPRLRKLDICGCGLTNEQMEGLMADYPAVKLVWTVTVGKRIIRTDATGFSTKNPGRFTSDKASDEYNEKVRTAVRLYPGDIEVLKYCTDLVALDLGHNYLTADDLDVLQYLPHLQILILADNRINDISMLTCLQELKYVELFMNPIEDVSPLLELPDLIDINICNIKLKDPTPLYSFTHAERLWFAMNGISYTIGKEIADALPNCECNYTTSDETGEGWREHPRYRWMRDFFN